VPIICEPAATKQRPRTTYEAQFSLPFSVAAAFVDGGVGIDTFSPSRLSDQRVLGLAAKVGYVIDGDAGFPAMLPGRVRVRMTDGRVLETQVEDSRPPGRQAIIEKFRANAERALSPARVAELEARVLELARAPSVAPVVALCRA
jgi:2-methylcitrate dehydratase PrpD